MTTLTMNYKSSYKAPSLMTVLLLCVLCVIVVKAVIYCEHAVARHGQDAEQVRQCMRERGPVAHLMNISNGRHYFVCQLDERTFGIQIMVKSGQTWREVSSFTKNKLHTLEQVIRYLNNGGVH